MTRRPIRIPTSGRPVIDIGSAGRAGPPGSNVFSRAQIEQIARTVRRTPEVMVKVTGGGTRVGAVSAHLAYINRRGKLDIETDEGQRIGSDEQKAFLEDWHLELSAGQYRQRPVERDTHRTPKLVHHIVLSMPAPTPAEPVLAAARTFAREKFGLQHRYALVLHTDQRHPHVHVVVKAEGEQGRRLHIDKQMLREWREDFARMMREQGIAANATSRVLRGRNKSATKEQIFRAKGPGASKAFRNRVTAIAREIEATGTVRDPARLKLLETRRAIVTNWMKTAELLDAQGEIVLAGDVRYFAHHLPPVMTDRERLAAQFIQHLNARKSQDGSTPPHRARDRSADLSR